ncbi:hypothetical protein [Hyphococcus sp.]|uniref:hypothetical protein n=1 Tax=Hyphococcus sp. TaxID=2038636 RepID=UPI0020877259|nr:MAG: hypothetical protein DHS20C04_32310 [Marinicaulis sp.]
MKQLRKDAIDNILNQLDQGVVSRHHFQAQFNQSDGLLVSIVFRDTPSYYFKIYQPGSSNNTGPQWATEESPGEYFTSEETFKQPYFSNAHSRVAHWVGRLIKELTVEDTADRRWITELRANVDSTADSLPEPEQPFSEPEVEEWAGRLRPLIEQLQKSEEEGTIQKGQVAKLTRRLAELKTSGTVTPKRTWLKTVGHKIVDLFEHGAKAAIKSVAEGAVKGLLDL